MSDYIQHLESTNYNLRYWAEKERLTLRNLWLRFWSRWFWISPKTCLPKFEQIVKVKGELPEWCRSMQYNPGDWLQSDYWKLVTKWKAI